MSGYKMHNVVEKRIAFHQILNLILFNLLSIVYMAMECKKSSLFINFVLTFFYDQKRNKPFFRLINYKVKPSGKKSFVFFVIDCKSLFNQKPSLLVIFFIAGKML